MKTDKRYEFWVIACQDKDSTLTISNDDEPSYEMPTPVHTTYFLSQSLVTPGRKPKNQAEPDYVRHIRYAAKFETEEDAENFLKSVREMNPGVFPHVPRQRQVPYLEREMETTDGKKALGVPEVRVAYRKVSVEDREGSFDVVRSMPPASSCEKFYIAQLGINVGDPGEDEMVYTSMHFVSMLPDNLSSNGEEWGEKISHSRAINYSTSSYRMYAEDLFRERSGFLPDCLEEVLPGQEFSAFKISRLRSFERERCRSGQIFVSRI